MGMDSLIEFIPVFVMKVLGLWEMFDSNLHGYELVDEGTS